VNLTTAIAAVAWLACAYWSVSYVRMANVLVRRIVDNDPAFWTRDLSHRNCGRTQYYSQFSGGARRLGRIVLLGRSAGLPQDENFRDLLGDTRWAAGFALFFWTVAVVATGMLSLPASP